MASEAALLSLHSQLEEGKAARGGGSGGLGYEKKGGSSKAPKAKPSKSKAPKALDKAQKREFASTTAGAIAAGHWDPWARPVEFKMKEANRTAGGLYSMFVKGATMGGTISSPSPAAPPPTHAATSVESRKRAAKQKGRASQSKDGRHSKSAAAAAAERESTPSESKPAAGASDGFKWKREIRREIKAVLSQAPGRRCDLKELRKRVVKTAMRSLRQEAASKPALRKKFSMMLKRMGGVERTGSSVRLSA